MSYKKQPREFITLFPCDRCKGPLNSTEYINGKVCTACIKVEKGFKPTIEPEREKTSKILAQLAAWELQGKEFILESGIWINYMGKVFSCDVIAGADLQPYAIIRHLQTIIYNNGEGTEEGKDVYQYATNSENGILRRNVN